MNIALVSDRYDRSFERGSDITNRILYEYISEVHTITIISSNIQRFGHDLSIFSPKKPTSFGQTSTVKRYVRVRTYSLIGAALYVLGRLMIFGSGLFRDSYKLRKIAEILIILGSGPLSPKIRDIIRKGNFHVVHSMGFPNSNTYIAFLTCINRNIPFVYTPNFHYNIEEYKNNLIFKEILLGSKVIVAKTDIEKQKIVELGIHESKIVTIPATVEDYSNELDLQNIKKFLKDYSLEDKKIVLTHPWVGKGARLVLESLSHVSTKLDNIALLTIGTPDKEYNELKSSISAESRNLQIVDLGWVDQGFKQIAFNVCNIFVLPTKNDAFGISFLDAWIAKKPVIALKNTAQEEFIDNQVNGILLDEEDPILLSNYIIRLLSDSLGSERMGLSGYSKYLEKFKVETIVKQYTETFVRAVQGK